MLSRSVVPIFLGQAEVDEEELVAVPPDPHEEVVRLDISVDEVLIVNIPRTQVTLQSLNTGRGQSYSILPII